MDASFRMIELGLQGFYCSQILISLGLEAQGKSNPDLVRAMAGLAGGLGFTGDTCGALSGGACLLGLYAGKGQKEEEEIGQLNLMVRDLVEWFWRAYGEAFGGIRCERILDNDPRNRLARCPSIVAATYQEVTELLVANGFDLSTGRSDVLKRSDG